MSNTAHAFTRRQALGITVGLTTGALLAGGAGAAVAAPRERAWRGARSQNGWPIDGRTATFRIEGTNVDVRLAKGDASTVLLYVARRFAYEIDMLRSGDVQGHGTDRQVGAPFESNHLSGTAIAIRPLFYPLDADEATGMSEQERTVVRDILADCQDVVAWGGDLRPVKESHFQINVPPGDPRLSRLAQRIQGWDTAPGQGAGSIDAFAPARLRRAAKVTVAR
ncbi:hypothetical protein [Streptomyces sp. NBC_00151]|uniref:hypothetical protein n=1 Tax=Streptomyces sp. NBC_00151 TaxID=2975669 RepID=UPI002DDBE79F|nr:hypothetical protein [Streptomyces sp. NBC_00151]WRZ39948.1 hypothetical protein OG915_19010 [Streptomyces sp. NBC_00151]